MACTSTGSLSSRGRDHGGDGRRRAGHVHLHVEHGVGRLQAQAARVEGQPLAHERDLRRAGLLGLVGEMEEARLLGAAAVHGEQQRHAELLDALLVPDLARDADPLRLGRGDVGELRWRSSRWAGS